MVKTFSIATEPVGETYAALLDLAGKECASFSLVWRDQLDLGTLATSIANAIRPDLIREVRDTSWPGTSLTGHFATVRHYRVNANTLQVLRAASGLYAWLAPDRPEDLVFYKADGAVFMAS